MHIDDCRFLIVMLWTLLQTLPKTMAGRAIVSDTEQYNRIFIIGISSDSTSEEIRNAFDPFGQITDVYIPRSKSKFILIISHIFSILTSFVFRLICSLCDYVCRPLC